MKILRLKQNVAHIQCRHLLLCCRRQIQTFVWRQRLQWRQRLPQPDLLNRLYSGRLSNNEKEATLLNREFKNVLECSSWDIHVSLPDFLQSLMMSSQEKTEKCPDCDKSFKDLYAVNRHVQSGRCPAVRTAPARRTSGRRDENPPEIDHLILRQDMELEELLSSSQCPFARYGSFYQLFNR